jgi:competence protein ComEC
MIPNINQFLPAPVLCAALSSAIGFYFLADCHIALSVFILVLSLFVLSLLHVLSFFDRENRMLHLMSVCSLAISTGLVLGICAQGAGHREINFSLDTERITAIEGVLLEDPRIISSGNVMVTLTLKKCAAEGGIRASSKGEITVFFPQESREKLKEFGRGASVFAEGRLRKTEQSNFSGNGYTFSANSMHIIKPAPSIERLRTDIRKNLTKRFDGKKWGGLALALLIGVKDNLDTNLTVLYRNAGVSYILALAGMNLAVITAIIAFLLKKPLGVKTAAITSVFIICLYCFVVGPTPSLNRSALMYILGVITILGFLPKKPLYVLALSFLIQIIITPGAGNTLSFSLSYLALSGILILTPLLSSLFAGKVPDFILQPLAVSCGAFIATAGITSFSFGIIVPTGIITSLLIVPLTTIFMIGSIGWLLLDFISLSGFLNMPLSLLYFTMEGIVRITGKVPGIHIGSPSLIIALSVFLSLMIFTFEYKQRMARLKLQPFSV